MRLFKFYVDMNMDNRFTNIYIRAIDGNAGFISAITNGLYWFTFYFLNNK